jgi:hypothetical protein
MKTSVYVGTSIDGFIARKDGDIDENYNLNSIISIAKRFIAYEIENRLKQLHKSDILHQLESGLSEREKKKGQLHKVF